MGPRPNLLNALNLRDFSNTWNSIKILVEFRLKYDLPLAKETTIYKTFIHNPIKGYQHQAFENNIIKKTSPN